MANKKHIFHYFAVSSYFGFGSSRFVDVIDVIYSICIFLPLIAYICFTSFAIQIDGIVNV